MWRDWGETRVDHEKTSGKTRGQFSYIRQSTNACWTSTTSTLLGTIHNILELTPGGGQVIQGGESSRLDKRVLLYLVWIVIYSVGILCKMNRGSIEMGVLCRMWVFYIQREIVIQRMGCEIVLNREGNILQRGVTQGGNYIDNGHFLQNRDAKQSMELLL